MWWNKQRKEDLVQKWFPVFNQKKSPERISLSRTSLRESDMYVVYIREGDDDNGYLFEGMEGNELLVKKYNPAQEAFTTRTRLKITGISPKQVYGTHYYLGYRIDFANLEHLEKINKEKTQDGIREERDLEEQQQRWYNAEERRVNDRMDVLNAVIELYLKDGHHHGLRKIGERIHTFRWEGHPNYNAIKRDLSLVLESFVQGGELLLDADDGYTPTGKAYATQYEYALQTRRHNENASLQRGTKRATSLAAWAAFFSALASFTALFLTK